MNPIVTLPSQRTARQRRLRAVVKRLVIELGHLEHCLAEGVPDAHIRTAAAGIDQAIDCLNDYLTSC